MVVHNPNNWHWIDKNCLPWSKDYFQANIKDTTFENEQYKFIITEVDSVTGDCDVTQRKGKVLCIYDMRLEFSVSSSDKKKTDASAILGTITLPEFVHDEEEDEYVFEIKSSGDHVSEIRKSLVPVLRSKLMRFQQDLLDAHAKDVQHASDQ
ncbi:uncharacterized protein LODBEIA_P42350 [Lodderomyces beijingensis]|uniref:Activator of Hsp90 ATPase AHSA1-like N-terminal domain-containing protein n=1 Tax=Lodderomyces beijingensis TaxID=1775926 RepID=A0ABP0ZSD0_9ASCO